MLSICDAGLEEVYGEAREQYLIRDERLISKVLIRRMRDFLGIPNEECAISPLSHRAQKRLAVEDVHAFQALGAREVGLVVRKRPMYAKNVQLHQTRVTQLTNLPTLQHLGLRKGTAGRVWSLELPASSP